MKDVVAVVLVGGQGRRLKSITKNTTKPAVSFFGKYKLIDFTLSSLSYSGISHIGIITQYEPYDLMSYIGSGSSFDLDNADGGIKFLTPYQTNKDFVWQKGTANALKQHMAFLNNYNAKYVIITPGDHVYFMDYREMLEKHINSKASLTIATYKPTGEDLSRFGVVEVKDNRIIGFEEKPKKPKSDLISMGIYIFNIDTLKKYLKYSDVLVDFGKDIIPLIIKERKDVFSYEFKGFWRDVGTVNSLYEANFHILDNMNSFVRTHIASLIYSRSLNLKPHILKDGYAHNSIISDGVISYGEINHSIISYSCLIDSGSYIEDSILLPRVKVGKNVRLKNVIVVEGLVIPDNTIIEPLEVTLIDSKYFSEGSEDR